MKTEYKPVKLPRHLLPQRNDLCPCLNGKKYKKCSCNHLKLYEIPPTERISASHITNMKDDVLFRVSYQDLPEPYPQQIDDWLENNVIAEFGCWWNSHSLGLSEINGIDMVNGYYGFKWKDRVDMFKEAPSVEKLKESYELHIKHEKRPQPYQKDGLFRILPPIGAKYGYDWIDFKNEIFYQRHSWNKLQNAGTKKKGLGKDIHFDLTTEFWDDTSNVWTYLNEVETIPSGSIKRNKELNEIYNNTIQKFSGQRGITDLKTQYHRRQTPKNNFWNYFKKKWED